MSERLPKHLDDAQHAAVLAMRFLSGRTLGDYLADEFLPSAVERQVEIVCEACRRALADTPELRNSLLRRRAGYRHAQPHRTSLRRDRPFGRDECRDCARRQRVSMRSRCTSPWWSTCALPRPRSTPDTSHDRAMANHGA